MEIFYYSERTRALVSLAVSGDDQEKASWRYSEVSESPNDIQVSDIANIKVDVREEDKSTIYSVSNPSETWQTWRPLTQTTLNNDTWKRHFSHKSRRGARDQD